MCAAATDIASLRCNTFGMLHAAPMLAAISSRSSAALADFPIDAHCDTWPSVPQMFQRTQRTLRNAPGLLPLEPPWSKLTIQMVSAISG